VELAHSFFLWSNLRELWNHSEHTKESNEYDST
jgi:hypothetical protein